MNNDVKVGPWKCFLLLIVPYGLILFSNPVIAQSQSTESYRALLIPSAKTTLSSPISGLITNVNVKSGDGFRKGQTLIQYDCRLRVAEHNAERAELRSQLENLKSVKTMRKMNAASLTEERIAQAGVDKRQALTEIKRIEVTLCKIVAPFSGKVVNRHIDPHQVVDFGIPMLEIIDNRVTVLFNVPSSLIKKLKINGRFSLIIDELRKKYTAKVIRIGAQIAEGSRTLPVWGRVLAKDSQLIPGMSGTASLLEDNHALP